jgi:large subunit ribosomal protein L13
MKTYSPKPEHIERRWYVIDASGAVLGRLASEVAAILRGKHKPIFAPHMDTGDHVVVVNASKIELTGDKETKKVAYQHSGYPGGIKATAYGRLMTEKPAFAVEKAIRGMLPKNRLGRAMIKKLHVVPGPEHKHRAQKPVELKLGEHPAWGGLPVPKIATAPEPKATPRPKPAAKTAAPAAKRTAKPKATAAKRTTATSKATSAKPKPATARTKATTAKKAATTAKKAATTAKKAATTKAPRKRRSKEEGD